MLHEPNLLLLDEPTNFLDLRTQILLEHFLRNYKEACLIVSHDRSFLGATCTHTLDLTRGNLTMYSGKIDAFLENQQEQRERDERTNATVLAKRRHLEEFIAKNKARASTATRARSKSRQLEKLETIEIAGDEAKAVIRAPEVEPRKGPAVRCRDLAIGYPEREVARDIDLEIDHGSRAAVVGDNGQGKTTLLRTLVDSLKPLAGEVRWGYGCTVGIYAQHVYTSLPDRQTVMEYLETTPPPAPRRRRSSTRRRPCCSAATTSKSRSRSSPEASGPACAWRDCCWPVQRPRPRRAGQPPRRRHGRVAGRGAAWATRGR